MCATIATIFTLNVFQYLPIAIFTLFFQLGYFEQKSSFFVFFCEDFGNFSVSLADMVGNLLQYWW